MSKQAVGTFTVTNGTVTFDGSVTDSDPGNVGKNVHYDGTYSPQQKSPGIFYNSKLTYNDIGDIAGKLTFNGKIQHEVITLNLDGGITITSSKASIATTADITGTGDATHD